jgi:glutathione-regulated potassium-efflux system ancillary protein KefG
MSVNLRRLLRVAPTVDTDDLIDSQEVADLLGLSHRNSVSTYLRRYDDFPRPVVERGGGRTRLWLRSDMVDWSNRR